MAVPAYILDTFPKLSDSVYAQRLARPPKGAKVIIDTDTANEIDDQYALAWALLSLDRLNVIGVTAEPFCFAHHQQDLIEQCANLKNKVYEADGTSPYIASGWAQRLVQQDIDPATDLIFTTVKQGAELSYCEIIRVFEKCHQDPTGKVFRGSESYLPAWDTPVDSPSAQFIIDQARACRADEPLYILAMGTLTNIASAMLMAADIINNIVVVWTSSFPSYAPFAHTASLNLVQDIKASQLLFACGVPHVYLPGYHVGAQLKISLPEMERFVKGKGDIGDYLHHLYTHNPLHTLFAISNTETKTWVIWDIINVAWMLDATYVPDFITTSPVLMDDLKYHHPENAHPMREAYDVDRDSIFEDLYACLQTQVR